MAEIIPDCASIIIYKTDDGFITEVDRVKDKGIHIVLKKQKMQNPLDQGAPLTGNRVRGLLAGQGSPICQV